MFSILSNVGTSGKVLHECTSCRLMLADPDPFCFPSVRALFHIHNQHKDLLESESASGQICGQHGGNQRLLFPPLHLCSRPSLGILQKMASPHFLLEETIFGFSKGKRTFLNYILCNVGKEYSNTNSNANANGGACTYVEAQASDSAHAKATASPKARAKAGPIPSAKAIASPSASACADPKANANTNAKAKANPNATATAYPSAKAIAYSTATAIANPNAKATAHASSKNHV